jgi:Cu(I)/Ag(I) efflux system membrane fusion protein
VIAAGAPLADLLLPEWVAAQREFLAVRALKDESVDRRRPGNGCCCWACPQALVAQVERTASPRGSTP